MSNRNNPRDPYRHRNPIAKHLMDERDGTFKLRVVAPKDKYRRIKLQPKDINLEEENEYNN